MEEKTYLEQRKHNLIRAFLISDRPHGSTLESGLVDELAMVAGLQKLQNSALTSLYWECGDSSIDMNFIHKYINICRKQ